jgi:hypothetical protein
MSQFRVKKPISNLDTKRSVELEKFTKDADIHAINNRPINRTAKPTKSFTVPLNEYELGLLQQLAKNLDRSQRYMSRKLLVKILEQELGIKH